MRRAGVCIGVPGIIYSMLLPSQVLRPKSLRGETSFGVSESGESLLVTGFESPSVQSSGQ